MSWLATRSPVFTSRLSANPHPHSLSYLARHCRSEPSHPTATLRSKPFAIFSEPALRNPATAGPRCAKVFRASKTCGVGEFCPIRKASFREAEIIIFFADLVSRAIWFFSGFQAPLGRSGRRKARTKTQTKPTKTCRHVNETSAFVHLVDKEVALESQRHTCGVAEYRENPAVCGELRWCKSAHLDFLDSLERETGRAPQRNLREAQILYS